MAILYHSGGRGYVLYGGGTYNLDNSYHRGSVGLLSR